MIIKVRPYKQNGTITKLYIQKSGRINNSNKLIRISNDFCIEMNNLVTKYVQKNCGVYVCNHFREYYDLYILRTENEIRNITLLKRIMI